MALSEQEKLWYRVARLEKAIKDKYGDRIVSNAKKYWNDEKELKYREELKEVWKNEYNRRADSDIIEKNGYLVSKKLFRKENRQCLVCSTYSFEIRDELYFNKYDCCWLCYIKWVEDREERWAAGWRPNLEDNK